MILYYIIQTLLFVVFGKLFDNYLFIIIGSICSVFLQMFTYTHHCHKLEHCIIITQSLFIIFGTLSKITPLYVIFLLCLYSIRDIYQKAPIKLNDDFIGKDEDWHFKRVVLIMIIYLIISLILYYFGFYEICKCIMLSLILVDLMLFKNDKEYI